MKTPSTFLERTVLALLLSACGNASVDSDQGAPLLPAARAGAKGALEVRLVDAPSDDVKEIVVTVTRVTAHVAGGGGWVTLAEKTGTIDMLKLQGGSFVQLGVVQMPAGRITQLRLYVHEDGPNYVTTPDGVQHPLKVPSGPESGIKIKAGFEWPACGTGNATIDFDGKKSIFVHPKGAGAGDEWLLRPVVRLKSVTATGDGCGPDAGASEPPPAPIDPPAAVNPPPVMAPPPGDPCANVTCDGSHYCNNGSCTPVIE
jgi:hypothetical protein